MEANPLNKRVMARMRRWCRQKVTPATRERGLRKLAESVGLTSDALRARVRRLAAKRGMDYPLMRAQACHHREAERADRRAVRAAWRADRIEKGRIALARGASWDEIARIFGVCTAEGALQWWARNAPEE